jgi:iron(III) transport system permease protein
MTVVDLYGYRTIADEFYLFYATDPSVLSILVTCFLPLAITGAFLTWISISRRRLVFVQNEHRSRQMPCESPSAAWGWLSGLTVITVACVVTLVPIIGLIAKLGHETILTDQSMIARWSSSAAITRLLEAPSLFSHEYIWTGIIGLAAGLATTCLAWPLAGFARTRPKLETSLNLLTVLAFVIPGPIVGLAIVSLFQMPFPGFHAIYQQTILPTVLALLIRSLPVGYWIMRSGYRGISSSVLETAEMEMGLIRRIWKVDRTLLKRSLIATMIASALFASGDVPATLPVIPPGVTTVGTRLFGLLHSGARYQEAALALWYVGAVVIITLIWVRQRPLPRVRVE